MTPETFFENFAHIAEAPNGVKKLRELILQMAVQGKLVPQDPSDEPASKLLERIRAEKARLVKEKKIRKSEPLPPVAADEMPHALPQRWVWVRLEEGFYPISTSSNKINTSNIEEVGKHPVVDQGKSHIAGYINDSDKLISIPGPVIVFGDHTRAIKFIDFDFVAGADGVKILRPLFIHELYFFWVLKSYDLESRGYGRHYSILLSNLFPLPPLAEQHRIVAKVDQLMTLCDELEVKQQRTRVKLTRLNNAALDRLTSACAADDFTVAWHLLRDNFDLLYTTPETIAKLRQSILQLAVQGKLVEQDPKDEPASVLLERIRVKKEKLGREGKIKKSDTLPIITNDERPFDLPLGWEFVRLGNITNRIGSGSTPRGGQNVYANSGILFLRSQNIWNDGVELRDVAYISEEIHKKMSNTVVYPNDILLNITGASLGRCAIYPDGIGEANVSQHVTIIRPTETATIAYLHLCILSPYTQTLVWGRQVGMAREGLSKKILELFEIPLPPLEEQKRIAAKVDQLMAICDRLESMLTKSQVKAEKLAEAAVQGLLTA